jgi:hypothetical chaperone protein
LERWHYLSFLRGRDVMNTLRSIRVQAVEPEKIEALIQLIEDDLGYQLHRAVQKVKCDLSAARTAEFRFAAGGIDIQATVERRSFERWIAEELLIQETSTWSSSREAPLLCPLSAGSSHPASGRSGFVPATNLPPWREV